MWCKSRDGFPKLDDGHCVAVNLQDQDLFQVIKVDRFNLL